MGTKPGLSVSANTPPSFCALVISPKKKSRGEACEHHKRRRPREQPRHLLLRHIAHVMHTRHRTCAQHLHCLFRIPPFGTRHNQIESILQIGVQGLRSDLKLALEVLSEALEICVTALEAQLAEGNRLWRIQARARPAEALVTQPLQGGAIEGDPKQPLQLQAAEAGLPESKVSLSAVLEQAVSSLKAQERAMAARAERSEHLSGEIISSLTAGLLVVELDGQVRMLNPAARRLLRVPDEGPADRSFRDLLGDSPLASTIDECLGLGRPVIRRSIELPSPAGEPVHFGVTVSPLFDAGGALHGAICLFSDLTAIKDLESQLRLKESLAAVGELTAGIAHEFRNGLATIQGYSKLLEKDPLPAH